MTIFKIVLNYRHELGTTLIKSFKKNYLSFRFLDIVVCITYFFSFPSSECRQQFIDVGTRYDKKSDTSSCMGCEKLRNCTSVFGSVRLKGISFSNRNKHLRKELHFPHLREITGHLIVTFLQDGATSVSDILPNLAVIHGRVEQLFQGYALVVYKNKGLQNLGLNSLTLIKQGGIKIEFNPQLCYLDRIRWQSLMGNGEAKKYELAMKGNLKDCFEKCSESCNTPSGHGSSGHKYCWGRKKQNCQKCEYLLFLKESDQSIQLD